ncbi:unnamed protein product [Rhizoctonia solani]|uniref:Uncharacterized protein n=1 Tax=Rhizoctonia solani TaxID=456999 RepID=A0A8H3AW41_9AGAM|nr:unnamed protein product [Rhizoctonia solani]
MPIDGNREIVIEQPDEAWLIDPCSTLEGNLETFAHFLNSDALAERRLALRTIATVLCLRGANNWSCAQLLQAVAQNSQKEQLYCSVFKSCKQEIYLLKSTHLWVLAMLKALPCHGYDPLTEASSERFEKVIELLGHEMKAVGLQELENISSTGLNEQDIWGW